MSHFASPSLRLCAALLAAFGTAAPATAVTIGFVPGSVTVDPGESFVMDVVVSELDGEFVSAYDLDIFFDPAVLQVDFVVQTEILGQTAEIEAFYDAVVTAGLVDIAGLSLLPDAALPSLQDGSTVILASIGFRAGGIGSTTLAFVFDATNDIKGLGARVLDVEPASGHVEVIPEPSPIFTFAAGLVLFAWAQRRRSLAATSAR